MTLSQDKIKDAEWKRGNALSSFAFIEFAMRKVIVDHYAKGNADFDQDLLQDENFGFFLLKKIFLKVLKKTPGEFESFPRKDLDIANTNRNIIAHSLIIGDFGIDDDPKHLKAFAFVHGGKRYDIDEVMKEFFRANNVVQGALRKLPAIDFTQFDASN